MKRIITTAILTAASTFAFANESTVAKTLSELSLEKKAHRMEMVSSKPGFAYLRMAVNDSHPTNSLDIIPGLGAGYRLMSGNGAFDFSANYNSAKGWKNEHKSYFWTLPKAAYIHYLNPESDQSPYAGVGLAWGEVRTKDAREFAGIIPNISLGFEFYRKAPVRTFTELSISQPAIANTVSDKFPGPIAEFSVGAGF